MAETDEVIRLVLKTSGQDALENLRKSTENYRSVLEDVTVQFAKGEITAEEYERKLRKVGKEYENQTALLRRFTNEVEARETARKASAEAATAERVELLRLAEASMDAAVAEGRLADDAADATAAQKALARSLDATADQASRTTTVVVGAGSAVDGLGRRADGAAKSTAGFGQSAVQAGRFLQDFQAAGIMGVANNLEQLSMAMGGGPGLAGALTLAAVAYLAFKPQLEHLLASLSGDGGANSLPDAAARTAAALKNVSERLDALKEKQSLTNKELVEYLRLSVDQVRLEKEKTDEIKKRADVEKMLDRERPEKVDEEKEAAKTIQESLGGQQDQLVEGVRQTLPSKDVDRAGKRFDEANEALAAERKGLEEELAKPRELGIVAAWERSTRISAAERGVANAEKDLDTARAKLSIEEKKLTERAQDVVASAMERGQTARLAAAMALAPGAFTDEQKDVVRQTRPEGREEAEREAAAEAAFDAAIARRQEAVKQRDEKRKEQDEQDASLYDAEAERFQAQLDARKEAVKRRDAEEKRRENEPIAQRAERALADRFAAEPGTTRGEAEALAKRSSQLRAAQLPAEMADRQARDELKAANDPEKFEEVRQRGDDLMARARGDDRAADQATSAPRVLANQIAEAGWLPDGANEQDAMAVSRRALDLMGSGQWAPQQAVAQALRELVSLAEGNVAGWQTLKAQADMASAQLRSMTARQQTILRRNW